MSKKTLAALVALAAGGSAFAQTQVSMFGTVDVGVTHFDTANGGPKGTRVTQGGARASNIGFSAREDLGDGAFARIHLEADFNPDTGTGGRTSPDNQTSTAVGGLVFNRQSFIAIGTSSLGEIRLGRDYTATFYNHVLSDPFAGRGVSTNLILLNANINTLTGGARAGSAVAANADVRMSNSAAYYTPGSNVFGSNVNGGFAAMVMVANSDVPHDAVSPLNPCPTGGTLSGVTCSNGAAAATNGRDGRYFGARANYIWASGLNITVATGIAYLSAVGNIKTTNIGGHYDFGPVKFWAEYNVTKEGVGTAGNGYKTDGYLVGLTIPVPAGVGSIRAAYSSVHGTNNTGLDAKSGLAAVGYLYNLSKRTALYANLAHVSNKGGAALSPNLLNGPAGPANAGVMAYEAGLKHSF